MLFRSLVASFGAAGFVEIVAAVEDPGEDWLVTEESVDARIDARGSPAQPSLRERWGAALAPAEVESLIGRLKSLAGTTVTFRRPQLFLSARRP